MKVIKVFKQQKWKISREYQKEELGAIRIITKTAERREANGAMGT